MTELIVALDVASLRQEEELLKKLKGTVTYFKVGLTLFTAHGNRAVNLVHRYGGRVFLDLKLHDIPQQIAGAVSSAQKLGVESLSVHLSGGLAALSAAVNVQPRPKLWGVSILTSLSLQDLKPFNPQAQMQDIVLDLAKNGQRAGLDGIVCSPLEVAFLRQHMGSAAPSFITPGIRPAGGNKDDQKRTATPAEAARLGISTIVVGRPITAASDPLKAAQSILREIKLSSPLETP